MSFGSHGTTAQAAAHAEIVPVHNQGWGPKERVWNSHVMVHFVPESSWQGQGWNSAILEVLCNLNDSVNRLSLPLSQPGQPRSKGSSSQWCYQPSSTSKLSLQIQDGQVALGELEDLSMPKWDFSLMFHSLILIW